MMSVAICSLNPSPEGGGRSAKLTGWGILQANNPTRPLVAQSPALAPGVLWKERECRLAFAMATLPLQGRDGASQ